MFDKNRKVLDFLTQMRPILSKRYGGGSEGYTQAQIDRTFEEEKLNRRYLTFAYLAFCNDHSAEALGIPDQDIERFQDLISSTAGSGTSISADGFVSFGDGGGFGGDVGGGGGE